MPSKTKERALEIINVYLKAIETVKSIVASEGTLLCVPREALISLCFPAKSANFPAKKPPVRASALTGTEKHSSKKQHREASHNTK